MLGEVEGDTWWHFNLPEFRGLSHVDLTWVKALRTAREMGDCLSIDGMSMEEAELVEVMERVLYAPGQTYIQARNWEFLGMIDQLFHMFWEVNNKVRCLFI